jgi:vacuolar-type H+-ATPase subunit I/STV1
LEGAYTSLDRKVHNLQTSLRHTLSEVNSRLSEVEDAVDQLEGIPRRVDSLEYDLREAKEETERVESDLDGRISDVDGSVDRLTTRVAALERYLRQAEGAVVVDLDEDRGGELHALTVTVNKGLAAPAGLLADHERSRLKPDGDHLSSTPGRNGASTVPRSFAPPRSWPPRRPKTRSGRRPNSTSRRPRPRPGRLTAGSAR